MLDHEYHEWRSTYGMVLIRCAYHVHSGAMVSTMKNTMLIKSFKMLENVAY